MNFRVTSERYTASEQAFNFLPFYVIQCSFLVSSMDILDAF